MLIQGLHTAEAVAVAVDSTKKISRVVVQRPNGKSAIRGYVQRHTVNYAGNFNQQMLLRKRQKEELQRQLESRSITNTMLFTTLTETVDLENLSEDPYI